MIPTRGALRRIALALLLLALTAGPVGAAIIWRSATTSGPAEIVLRDLIRVEHYRVCARTITADTRLVWIARYRATDMVLMGYFAHRNPYTGKSAFDLMRTAGIPYTTGSEIIAWNTYPDDVSASTAFRQYMASSSHRAAIRNCAYKALGVGAYKVASKRMFAVVFTQ